MPLVSYTFASGNIQRMKKTVTFSLRISLSFLIAVTVLYLIFRRD